MNESNTANTPSQNSQAFGWKFWLWLASMFFVVLIVAIMLTAWAARSDAQSRTAHIVHTIGELPILINKAAIELWPYISGNPLPLLMERKSTEQANWIRRFPASEDNGYLLFSGVDPVAKRSTVQLIRISDGVSMAHWIPDWNAIYSQTTHAKYSSLRGFTVGRAMDPVLLDDGDIIFNSFSFLARLNPCNSTKPVWVLDEVMHHSTELDETNNALWVPSVAQDGYAENPWLRDKVRDDALAHVSIDGKLLERLSFARILRNNGLEALLLGMSGTLNTDPIHLNQIQVARQNSKYWQRGDLLISARNLSTLFLYRPSTGKIIWHQTGPWMNQHSVDFVDDHRISVFNNNVVSAGVFMKPGDTNQVLVYDFDTRQVSQPFAALLAQARPISLFEGRARLLPDGGLFLEETNYGRDMRFTKDKLLWSRVNDYDKERIGTVSWSRYLTAEEARIPLQALASRNCSAAK